VISLRTFQSGFGPHILGRVASTWTRVGAEGVGATWEYDLATGFVTSYVGPRSPLLRFTPRADGNLATLKDANNHETQFENYTWGQPQRVRTPTTTTDFSINPDGTIAYGGSAVVVHTNYDGLFRPIKTWSHAVNPVFHEYDNVGATGSSSTQGSASGGALVDGFGRPVLQYVGTGVKTHTGYDACGRAVTASQPYTSGAPAAIGTPGSGTTTTYDGLGRPKTITDPAGAITQIAYTGIDVTVTDAEGRATVYDYSAAGSPDGGRLMSVRDAATITTSYGYDVIDSLIRVSGPGPVRIGRGSTTAAVDC
jgi:YD repeat-containing protein